MAAALLTGCGSSGGTSLSQIKIGAARQYRLASFSPAGTVTAGQPVHVSFTVTQPNGKPLTAYKTGSGPHTGIHLIIVRDDLAYIIHHHPPLAADGQLNDTVSFPAPGPYRVLIDLYPARVTSGPPNFILLGHVTVAGAYHPKPLPPFRTDQTVGGLRFRISSGPSIPAAQATFVHVVVTDRHGQKVKFVPWYGALAHAIFFHAGSLDYFHTHVCAPGAANCGSVGGTSSVSGTSAQPGLLTLGILLPVPGSWELFLQLKPHGQVITVPYTLKVS